MLDTNKLKKKYGNHTGKEILSFCDHTILKQDSVWADVKRICDEGMLAKTASVCIQPSFVKQAVDYVEGKLPICTVIGFPNGYITTATKFFETSDAVKNGASEIDMVINIGALKERKYDELSNEIKAIKEACNGKLLKVIIETCLLTDDEKKIMCNIVANSGAEYIKTSTGFAGGGATFHDAELMVNETAGKIKVKAAGGIKSIDDAVKFLDLGVMRLGTSSLFKMFC
ncbi:MAG: deoxyribose-phosphate aldolase [Clostridia bacterium]|nr:deoxyribose-phosphate aldolase [Clostridia bacterium]